MKSVIWKAYFNYENEEKWLNDMAAKGLAMSDYSWCRYVFADCQPGEYIYRIELLAHRPAHPESMKYIRFMEESGAEHVASYNRWVYFRKKAADGPFEIYSDIDSKIAHYRKVSLFFIAVSFIAFATALLELVLGTVMTAVDGFTPLYFIFAGILTVIGIAVVLLGHPARKQIRKLRQEKEIRE